MSVRTRTFHPPVVTLLARPSSLRLTDLPNEMLNAVANYLRSTDLFKLRTLGNRRIRDGIDHAWAQRFFAHRTCRTTCTSIAHLETIALSRFAKHVRSIVFEIDLGCRTLETLANDKDALASNSYHTDQYSFAHLYLRLLYSKLMAIFNHTANLRTLEICAPQALPRLTDENLPYTLRAHGMGFGRWNELDSQRYHVMRLHTSCTVLHSIIMAVRESRQQIDALAILGFTTSTWKLYTWPSISVLKTLVAAPGVQSLTTLELELELLTSTSGVDMRDLVKLLEDNSKLQHLKLWAGADVYKSFRRPSNQWSALLDLLGTNPPFRLRSLDLDGLVTSGCTTLDRIIRVHSQTLRHIVLNHTNFRRPNSIRAFFAAMAETQLEYFAARCFWMHDRSWIEASTFTYQYRPDEVLDWSESHDEAYVGWVDFTWTGSNYGDWLIYSNEDGIYDEYWMQDKMMDVVTMVDCGGIQD